MAKEDSNALRVTCEHIDKLIPERPLLPTRPEKARTERETTATRKCELQVSAATYD